MAFLPCCLFDRGLLADTLQLPTPRALPCVDMHVMFVQWLNFRTVELGQQELFFYIRIMVVYRGHWFCWIISIILDSLFWILPVNSNDIALWMRLLIPLKHSMGVSWAVTQWWCFIYVEYLVGGVRSLLPMQCTGLPKHSLYCFLKSSKTFQSAGRNQVLWLPSTSPTLFPSAPSPEQVSQCLAGWGMKINVN